MTKSLDIRLNRETQDGISKDALDLLSKGYLLGRRNYTERKDLYDR